MKKLYIIRTQDLFEAQAKGQIPEGSIRQAGTLWAYLKLTKEEKNKYTFPIYELS
jgi:hypothetical protein